MKKNTDLLCKLCGKKASRYTCPRCNIAYCSSDCYRSEQHGHCSETFYKEQVHQQLRNHSAPAGSKQQMHEMLQRLEQQQEEAAVGEEGLLEEEEEELEEELDSDDDEDLADRLAGVDLDDSEAVWSRLSEDERRQFRQMVEAGDVTDILPDYEPWWLPTEDADDHLPKIVELDDTELQNMKEELAKTSLDGRSNKPEMLTDGQTVQSCSLEKPVIISDNNNKNVRLNQQAEGVQDSSTRGETKSCSGVKCKSRKKLASISLYDGVPACVTARYKGCPAPCRITPLEALISSPPAQCVRYSVINIVACCAWVTRLFHGDHQSNCREAAEAVLCLSAALRSSDGGVFPSTEQAVASVNIRALHYPWLCGGEQLMQAVAEDTVVMVTGPASLPGCFLHLALADLHALLRAARRENEGATSASAAGASKTGSFQSSMQGAVQSVPLTVSSRSSLTTAIKKLEFIMSYAVAHGRDVALEFAGHPLASLPL